MGPIKSSNLSPSGETEGANITTMKRYIKPTCEIIEVEISAILKASIYMGGNGEAIDIEEDDDETQLSGGHRGDWDNIWKDI